MNNTVRTALATLVLTSASVTALAHPLTPRDRAAPPLYGPFQLWVDYSDVYGATIHPKHISMIGDYTALGVELAFGRSEYRFVGTIGRWITDNSAAKFTIEYFTQQHEYTFITGDMDEWIKSYNYGLAYRYLFRDSFWSDIHAGVELIDGQSEVLDPKARAGTLYQRRITGGTVEGATLGIETTPWVSGVVIFEVHLDALKYDNDFTDDRNRSGFGVSASYEQFVADQWRFKLYGSNRVPWFEYRAETSWLFRTPPGSRAELVLAYSTVGGAIHEKEMRYTVGVNYSWGGSKYDIACDGYKNPMHPTLSQELVNWTNHEATRPPQTFGRIEQRIAM